MQQIICIDKTTDWEVFRPTKKKTPIDVIIAKYNLADYYWILNIEQSKFDELAAKTATSYNQINRIMESEGRCDIMIYNRFTNKERRFSLDTDRMLTSSNDLWVSQDTRGREPSIYLFIYTNK